MWIVRAKNGELFLFNRKHQYIWDFKLHPNEFLPLDKNLFPNITSEDKEPTEIEIVIKHNRQE